MSLSRFAVVMARLFGLGFMFQGLISLTYLPDRLFILTYASDQRAASVNIEVRLMVLRCVLHVMFGSALWIWSKSVADRLVKGLGEETGNEAPADPKWFR
jgi:hypothetical protein